MMGFADRVGDKSQQPQIDDLNDFLAFAGLFEHTIAQSVDGKGNASAVTQEIKMDIAKGQLRMHLADIVVDKLEGFLKKNGVEFAVEDSHAQGAKVVVISDLDSCRKLAVWGVRFTGAELLRSTALAAQAEQDASRQPG